MIDLDPELTLRLVEEGAKPTFRGTIELVSGVLVEAQGIPAALGEVCTIERGHGDSIDAEVVGFRGTHTLLMPFGDLAGIAPKQVVRATGRPFRCPVGDVLLGRILDGFGRPLDSPTGQYSESDFERAELRPIRREAPSPSDRRSVDEPLQTGLRVIDGLNTLGRGQRLGIFAGSGVGKSSLLGQVTRGTDADVVVTCLVGERGREVNSFVEDVLGPEGMERAVLVAATSDRSPIERFLAPFVAVTIAERFRDDGKNVLLVMDSVTRFALAAREIGLAAGEPPAVRGFPPSFFATVPKLIERMGRTQRGSITGLLTILLDGDDANDPVADTMRGLLDGHLFLSREMAQAGRFPAVDVLNSLSRLMPDLSSADHLQRAQTVRGLLAAHRDGKDLIDVGAYRPGANPELDEAVLRMPLIDPFLRQAPRETSSFEETVSMLDLVCSDLQAGGVA